MLKLEEKDYDLNFLFKFSFDFAMLKEILLKLAKSNKDLESRIKHLEKSNKEKDKRISNLEEKLNVEYIPEEKLESEPIKEGEEEIEDKNNTNDDYDNTKSNADKDKDNNSKKEKDKDIFDDEDFYNKEFKKKRSRSIRISRKEYDNLNSYVSYPVSSEAIRSLLKLIRENSEKISKVDKNLNNKITKSCNDLQKKIKNLDSQNEREHKIIDGKIKDLYSRLYDFNDKMDGIIVKTAPLDNLVMIKDSGNGTVDASKLMVKMLEEKINKRIEIIETRGISEGGGGKPVEGTDNLDLEQKVEELKEMTNRLKRDVDFLRRNINDLIETNFDEAIKELRDLIDKKYNDLLAIIEDLSNRLKNNEFTGDKMDELLKNIKSEKDKKPEPIRKNTYKKTSKIDEKEMAEANSKISDLKERIKDLNKKINDIDNYFKTIINTQGQDIGEIKRKLEEMDAVLSKKITKDDLKELNHITDEHSDELKYLQDKISELIEGLQKLQDNNPSFVKRIESLTHDILELKGREIKEVQSKPLDMTKYIDENKLKEALKTIKKNIDVLLFEKDSLYNQVKDIQDEMKYLESKERVNKLEEEFNEKINDIINIITKKYLDKIEISKMFKNFDVQMKLLSEGQKNKESDNWILAKKPIGCFNCATCEANINNLSPTNEYLPWNKYPQGERQFHVGQGFSRLLQRISNDIALKNFNNDKKDFSQDNDINASLYNSMSTIKGNSGFVFKINNRETMKEDFNENIFKNKKYKLPKVFSNRRKKNTSIDNLPLTDEEKERESNSFDNSNSPKILKITKKRPHNFNGAALKNNILMETNIKNDSMMIKPSSNLERVRSVPLYENV